MQRIITATTSGRILHLILHWSGREYDPPDSSMMSSKVFADSRSRVVSLALMPTYCCVRRSIEMINE
jgi:hypothetical protein